MHDSVTCVKVTDIDYDGSNEIIIGTYGQEILIYKVEEEVQPQRTTSSTQQEPNIDNKEKEKEKTRSLKFSLQCRYHVAYPIMQLHCADLDQEGIEKLIAVTVRGVYIFHVDLSKTIEKILEYLTVFKEIKLLDEKLEQEQKRALQLNTLFKSNLDMKKMDH